MILMYKKEGGYMNCYTAAQVDRAKSNGWTVVPDKPVDKPVKKVGRPRKVK